MRIEGILFGMPTGNCANSWFGDRFFLNNWRQKATNIEFAEFPKQLACDNLHSLLDFDTKQILVRFCREGKINTELLFWDH